MTCYKSYKLPPLKITHLTHSSAKKVLIHRGTSSALRGVGEKSNETVGEGNGEPILQTDSEFVAPTLQDLQTDPELVELTLH